MSVPGQTFRDGWKMASPKRLLSSQQNFSETYRENSKPGTCFACPSFLLGNHIAYKNNNSHNNNNSNSKDTSTENNTNNDYAIQLMIRIRVIRITVIPIKDMSIEHTSNIYIHTYIYIYTMYAYVYMHYIKSWTLMICLGKLFLCWPWSVDLSSVNTKSWQPKSCSKAPRRSGFRGPFRHGNAVAM